MIIRYEHARTISMTCIHPTHTYTRSAHTHTFTHTHRQRVALGMDGWLLRYRYISYVLNKIKFAMTVCSIQ